METPIHTSGHNPLLLPEIIMLVLKNINMPADLVSCALVNKLWSAEATRKLYAGSLEDMQLRTPDIESHRLFTESPERFVRNMRFARHLMLLPKLPSSYEMYEFSSPRNKLVCYDMLALARQTHDMDLVFQSPGPKTLSIPFEIISQDWSVTQTENLMFSSQAEFIAIDVSYCRSLFEAMLGRIKGDSIETARLKALTVYKQAVNSDIQWLLSLLGMSKLRSFHFSEGLQSGEGDFLNDKQHRMEGDTSLRQILPYLQAHEDLESLAFMEALCDQRESTQIPADAWPNLKALSLQGLSRHWIAHLGRWDKLQMLRLEWIPPSQTELRIDMISKCRTLTIIHLVFVRLGPRRKILKIAAACPHLRALKVYSASGATRRLQHGEKEDQELFFDFLGALPHIEVLAIGLNFLVDEFCLQNMSTLCPRITYAHLPNAQICLRPWMLSNVATLRNLKFLIGGSLSFEQPCNLSDERIHEIATEWHRIFPKLRPNPCHITGFTTHRWMDNHGNDRDYESLSQPKYAQTVSFGGDHIEYFYVDPEIGPTPNNPLTLRTFKITRRVRVGRHADQSNVYMKLWKALGFVEDPGNSPFTFARLWQIQMEKQIIGWPIIPLSAFIDPIPYSESSKPGNQADRWLLL